MPSAWRSHAEGGGNEAGSDSTSAGQILAAAASVFENRANKHANRFDQTSQDGSDDAHRVKLRENAGAE